MSLSAAFMPVHALAVAAMVLAAVSALVSAPWRGAAQGSRRWFNRTAALAAIAAIPLVLIRYAAVAASMAEDQREAIDAALAGVMFPSADGIALLVRVIGLTVVAMSLTRAFSASRAASTVGAALILGSFAIPGA